jgi:hypothetical protein
VAPVDRIQVVVKVQRYVAEGKCWVVALDLEKSSTGSITRSRWQRLRGGSRQEGAQVMRAFPTAGDGERAPPPLLSNLILTELDRLIRNSFCGYVARGGNLANILSTALSSFLVSFSGFSES